MHSKITVHLEENSFELHLLADYRNYNLLLVAAELGDAYFVKFMLNGGFSTDAYNTNAQTLAWYEHHFEILLMLLQNNLEFPLMSITDVEECPDIIKNFIAISKQLNDAILKEDKTKILEILEENQSLKYFYNLANESALAFALKNKLFEMYRLLISKNVRFGPFEDFNKLKENMRVSELNKLRTIHIEESICPPDNHMRILQSNSCFGHDTTDVEGKFIIIQKTFEALNSNPFMKLILMIVAASRNFRIIFDFNKKSVDFIDPTADSSTKGLFYLTGRIYIGAKELLDPNNEHQVFGTLAHELCHYAMNLVYNNLAKPYLKDDNNMRKKFERILEHCKLNSNGESIINDVFMLYSSSVHHAELIVRVPHLIMHYFKEPERLGKVRKTFNKLFNFFEKQVVPQMKKALPKIIKNAKKDIDTKNQEIQCYQIKNKILMVLCIISLFTTAIAIGYAHYESLQIQRIEYLKVSNVTYRGVQVELQNLIGNDFNAYNMIKSEYVNQLLKGEILNFSDLKLDDFVYFKWSNLTNPLKLKFLGSNFLLQGETLKFQDFFDIKSPIFDSLKSKQIVDSLNESVMSIGQVFNDEFLYNFVNNSDARFKTFSFNDAQWNQNVTIQRNFENFVSLISNDKIILPEFSIEQIVENFEKFKLSFVSSEIKNEYSELILCKELAKILKKYYPSKFIFCIDTTYFAEIFNNIKSINDLKVALENIFKPFLSDEFERKFFNALINSETVVLIWDKFDDLFHKEKKNIFEVLKIIKHYSNITQIVKTKILWPTNSKDRIPIKMYTFVPFNQQENDEFVRKSLISEKIEESQIPNYMLRIKNVTDFQESYGEAKTPLLLLLAADLIANDIEIYESMNIYEMYKKFISKKIEIWKEKSEFSRKFISSLLYEYQNFNMMSLYKAYALKSQLEISLSRVRLRVMYQRIPKELTFDEISRMGILYINSPKNFEFTHKSFADFFVAKFIEDELYFKNREISEAELYFRILTFYHSILNSGIRYFIDHFLKSLESRDIHLFDHKLAQVLKTKFSKFLFLKQFDKSHFPTLLNSFKIDHMVLKSLLQIDENETFYTSLFSYAHDFYTKYDPTVIRFSIRSYVSDDEYNKFIMGKNQKGVILFSSYCIHNNNLISANISHDIYILDSNFLNHNDPFYVFESITKNLTNDEFKELLISKIILAPISSPNRTKHYILNDKLWMMVENVFSSTQMKEILSKLFPYTFIEQDLIFLMNKLDKFMNNDEIYQQFFKCDAIYYILANSNTFDLVWNFMSNHTTREQQLRILEHSKFCDIEYLPIEIYTPYNMLFYSLIEVQNIELFVKLTEIYESYFNLPEMQKLITSSSDDFILKLVLITDSKIVELVANYLKRIFDINKKGLEEFLLRKIKPSYLNVFQLSETNEIPEENINILRNLLK